MADNAPSKGAAPAPVIVFPYAFHRLKPEVRSLGEQLGAVFADTSGTTAYFELLESLWQQGKSFTIVENDVLPTVSMLADMAGCDHEWCSGWYYQYDGAVRDGHIRPEHPRRYRVGDTLACVAFKASLLRRFPDAMQQAAHVSSARLWTQTDLSLNFVLNRLGARRHFHDPAVQHLREASMPRWLHMVGEDEWVDA